MVRVALMMCAICLLFSLDRGYAQDQQDQDVGRKKVDFQDGTWLSLNQTNTEVAINISPVERWVFLLGVQQNYQRIDGQERGYEFKPISDSSHTVLKMWSDGGVQYYNLLVDGQWHLGTRLHIHTDQDPERGRLRAVFFERCAVRTGRPMVDGADPESVSPTALSTQRFNAAPRI